MKIAALQMVSTPDVARNLDTARRLIAQAACEGVQLVALPEYFCHMGHNEREKLLVAEAPGDGPIQAMLAQAASGHGLWVIGGTLPLRIDGDTEHVRNACCVYAPDGSQAARYDKMHLFRFDDGNERYDEAQVLQAGSEVVSVQAGPLRLGLSVCYDLRFPELYRALGAVSPCDLIAVPSAFTFETGQAHWDLLLRARAVENQAYVVAPAQGGRHENGRRTWGHSMLIDPWGQVLACLPAGEGVVMADLGLQRIAFLRQRLPALAHRRLPIRQ